MRKLTALLLASIVYSLILSAQKINIDSVKAELQKPIADTSKVINYRILAGTLRLTNPAEGIKYGKAGVELGKKIGFDKGVAGCYLNITACYSSAGKLDSAIIYIDTAIVYSHRAGDPNRLALAYLNRADFHMQLQNFDQSLKDCDTSLRYAEQANNDDRRARVFQTIGSVYFFQKLYNQSEEYYNKANSLYRKINNMQMSAVVLNNLSSIHKNTEQYKKAADNLQQAISIADSLNDLSNLSLYYGTLSDVYFNSNELSLAEKYANISMQYAQQMKNELSIANAWEYLGQVYLKQKKNAEAITALNNGYLLFKKLDDYDKINTTTLLLADAYAASGNHVKAYEFVNLSRVANDTLVKRRYDENLAAMQARFRVNEKDKEILLLNKDKELQEQKLSRQRVLMAGSVVLVLFLILGIALLISRYRLRQRMKELELRNQIAADLHDEVGSSLSSIHMLSQIAVQKQGNAPHDEILGRVSSHAKETMEKMSDIVWMIKPGEKEGAGLVQRMQRFMHEMCGETDIETTLQVAPLEHAELTMHQRKNIYLIFKEALNNAVKYSGALKIEVTAKNENKKLELEIKDNGKGFDATQSSKGNGLRNMQNRAKELGGKLELISNNGSGSLVRLSMPV
jgi:two-component system sensor histidine kinase UhpB